MFLATANRTAFIFTGFEARKYYYNTQIIENNNNG
jgi:hypothetical protein